MMEFRSNVYRAEFSEREYSIMLEREQNGKTFNEIGLMFGVSDSRIRDIYVKSLHKRVRLYLMAIDRANGKPSNHLRERASELSDRFGSPEYAAAYLEKEYSEILTSYRAGEPESPFKVPDINVNYISQPLLKYARGSEISDNDRLTYVIVPNAGFIDSYKLFRFELNEFELSLLSERENNRTGFKEISEELGITVAMAKEIHGKARRVQLHKLLTVISKSTGIDFEDLLDEPSDEEKERWGWKKTQVYFLKKYDNMLNDN